jgi:predicted dehydrogenase
MRQVRVGVVGVGKMGEYHMGVLSDMADVSDIVVADVNEDRAKAIGEQFNVPWFTNHNDIKDKVDVVTIAVPTSQHHPVAKDFLTDGIHVLLEKPCSNDLEKARELFKIAEDNNLVLHIGHIERFNGAVQELHKIVDDPIFLESKRMGPYNNRIIDDGVVLDMMIHDIDIILNLVNSKVAKLNVMGLSVFSKIDDLVDVQLEFENKCIANILASRASQSKVRTLAITQKDSYVMLDYTDQEIYVHRQSTSEHLVRKDSLRYKQESLVERIFVHKDNPLKLELQHFIDCVQNGASRKVAVDRELYSLEIALGIVEKINQQNGIN